MTVEALSKQRIAKEPKLQEYRAAENRRKTFFGLSFLWLILLLIGLPFLPLAKDAGWLLVLFFLSWYVPYFLYMWLISRAQDRKVKLSQDAAFCLAFDAATELREGRHIQASIDTGKLMLALGQFFKKKATAFETWISTQRLGDILYIKRPDSSRKTISRAIQSCSRDEAREFSTRLMALAQALSGEMEDKQYHVLQQSLQWLIGKGGRSNGPAFLERLATDPDFALNFLKWVVVPIIVALIGTLAILIS